jgi:hypothetical protein
MTDNEEHQSTGSDKKVSGLNAVLIGTSIAIAIVFGIVALGRSGKSVGGDTRDNGSKPAVAEPAEVPKPPPSTHEWVLVDQMDGKSAGLKHMRTYLKEEGEPCDVDRHSIVDERMDPESKMRVGTDSLAINRVARALNNKQVLSITWCDYRGDAWRQLDIWRAEGWQLRVLDRKLRRTP